MYITSLKLYLTLLLGFTSLTWTVALPVDSGSTKNVASANSGSSSSENLNYTISNANPFSADTLSTNPWKATVQFTSRDHVDEEKLKFFKDAVQIILDTASPHLTVQGLTVEVSTWRDYPKAHLSFYYFYVHFEQDGHLFSFEGTISDQPNFITTWQTKREMSLSGKLHDLQSKADIISFQQGRYQLGEWNQDRIGEEMVSGSLEATVNFIGTGAPAVPDRHIQESAKFAAITVLNAAPTYLQSVSTIRVSKWDGYPVADHKHYFKFDVRFLSKALNPTTETGKHKLEVVDGIYKGRCSLDEKGRVTGRLIDPKGREVVSIVRGKIGQAAETIDNLKANAEGYIPSFVMNFHKSDRLHLSFSVAGRSRVIADMQIALRCGPSKCDVITLRVARNDRDSAPIGAPKLLYKHTRVGVGPDQE
ncbi:hypothetical protein EV368DRAFT_65043 [Lentinula lateritia]|nr:hypothetical protein EV368DRAFT_65043 [Lentinula lateritia]